LEDESMGHALLLFLFVALFDWVVFMSAIRFAQTFANVELPPGSMVWRVALVALAAGVASVGTGLLLGPLAGFIAGVLVFWTIMFKAYAIGAMPLLGAVVLTKVISYGLLTLTMGWLYPAAAAIS